MARPRLGEAERRTRTQKPYGTTRPMNGALAGVQFISEPSRRDKWDDSGPLEAESRRATLHPLTRADRNGAV